MDLAGFELEPLCGPERSGSPQAKSLALRGTSCKPVTEFRAAITPQAHRIEGYPVVQRERTVICHIAVFAFLLRDTDATRG